MNVKTKADNKQFVPQKYTFDLGDQIKTLNQEFEKFENLAKNPLALTNIFLGLKTAVDNFNSLLVDLNQNLKDLNDKLETVEAPKQHAPILSTKDQKIYDFVKARDKVCAEDLQDEFKYRGKNAASARLNKLYTMGVLDKIQSGRVVYYTIRANQRSAGSHYAGAGVAHHSTKS